MQLFCLCFELWSSLSKFVRLRFLLCVWYDRVYIAISTANCHQCTSYRAFYGVINCCRRVDVLDTVSVRLPVSIGTGILLLKGHFTHMKLFFKITEIETLINITYIVRFLRSTDVSVFYY